MEGHRQEWKAISEAERDQTADSSELRLLLETQPDSPLELRSQIKNCQVQHEVTSWLPEQRNQPGMIAICGVFLFCGVGDGYLSTHLQPDGTLKTSPANSSMGSFFLFLPSSSVGLDSLIIMKGSL